MKQPPPIFHAGERALQQRLGVADKMDGIARRTIRDHMPAQHQAFYEQLLFVLVGHVDAHGWPWASLVPGEKGFIQATTDRHLHLQAKPVNGDPLLQALQAHSASRPLQLGLLGIELETRRRNRLTGEVGVVSADSFDIHVFTTFGNCPKYIQTRTLEAAEPQSIPPTAAFNQFSNKVKQWIEQADTFFVATANTGSDQQADNPATDGADVSHRGGRPGFVRVDDARTLTIPDYVGNFYFNTLGNIVMNPKAGLLFVDFDNGHVLTLTGRADLLWNSPEVEHFHGAERLWRFHLEQGYLLQHRLPFRWTFGEYSPHNVSAGS